MQKCAAMHSGPNDELTGRPLGGGFLEIVQQGGLAGAGPTRDEDVAARLLHEPQRPLEGFRELE